MGKRIKVILTGLNGYGKNFVSELLREEVAADIQLVGVVSRNPKASEHYEKLLEKGARIYTSLEACFEQNEVDLAIITTPMHIHYEEVMCALRHGANVFCEKPLAPTIDECLEIQRVAEQLGKFVAVDFQWTYSKAVQHLKRDILAGRYGAIKSIKTVVNWNRPRSYFDQSNWKGKTKGQDGKYILESVMSNGAAHFLHNILFLCGETMQQSAYPVSIQGEGYKAHHVDGYDTIFARMMTEKGQELIYLATIVAKEGRRPQFVVELERATAYFPEGKEENIIVHTDSGEQMVYGSPEEGRFKHYLRAIEAIQTKVRVACDVETVLPEVIAVNAAVEYIPVYEFPKELIFSDEEMIYVKEIDRLLERCYEEKKLPNELGISWATPSEAIAIKGYDSFRGIEKREK